MRDGYNRVEVKGKEMFYMEAVVKDMDVVEDRTAVGLYAKKANHQFSSETEYIKELDKLVD